VPPRDAGHRHGRCAREAAEARHQAAYQDLLTRYQSLVERTASSVGVPATVATETPEPDLILQAAYERWGTDPGAMVYVNKFIADQRAKAERGEPDAMDERSILEKVLYGVSASEGVEF